MPLFVGGRLCQEILILLIVSWQRALNAFYAFSDVTCVYPCLLIKSWGKRFTTFRLLCFLSGFYFLFFFGFLNFSAFPVFISRVLQSLMKFRSQTFLQKIIIIVAFLSIYERFCILDNLKYTQTVVIVF